MQEEDLLGYKIIEEEKIKRELDIGFDRNRADDYVSELEEELQNLVRALESNSSFPTSSSLSTSIKLATPICSCLIEHIKSAEQYDEIMTAAGDKLVVVDYSATWCGPCQKIKPIFESLPSKYPNVIFLHCDIDELRDMAEVQTVEGVPTFRFWKSQKKVAEFSGANEAKLLSLIDAHK
ncbi:Thioredoxin [Monocercomonoides exilis]|uniref:Thioredoxin n=1 Tax=Monocercomonoides exilis TaxID=2049356 RepID=UPI00355A1841|nr:Thioredoxin [Monocercomonoides exilis]|eukprot:MONOS_6073.1-p1 / transcript=MONOS_6073.1 / gene=MONOS_6073 / organism=Monocercomonoides_exilis_PA203 / gene_product=Thioredoxin / transcript_product=Thioredoxin / location=Mono_scaffold00186:45158-46036(+) / protein_length=179 / sequence_SO=supercontig / SO=protein_coding / is_pseudo=false